MSIDKSLRRKNSLQRARSVLTRGERIRSLIETDRWQDGRSPFNLPKVRVIKIVTKKVKKEKAAEGEGGTGAEGAPAPEAKPEAKAAATKAEAKPAAKPAGKK